MSEQAIAQTFEPSFSAASDQGRMVESKAESFTAQKKPKIIYKKHGVTIYYNKNMLVNGWTLLDAHNWA